MVTDVSAMLVAAMIFLTVGPTAWNTFNCSWEGREPCMGNTDAEDILPKKKEDKKLFF